MRLLLVTLHRWLGLAIAGFLTITGLTGAIISWDHELDSWLNPAFYEIQAKPGTTAKPANYLSPLLLARQLEASDPRLQVTYLPLAHAAGHALSVSVEPRQSDHSLGFNQLAINPVDGSIQAQRQWGDISLARENLLPFLYKLHYSLHLPDSFGLELGVLLLGIIALIWVLDSLVAIAIAFPSRRQWRKSFALRWRQGGHKLTFDLHRSGGVWVWLLLLTLAITSVSMNLEFQVMRPLVNLISPLTPSPFVTHTPSSSAHSEPGWANAGISREHLLESAGVEASRLAIKSPAGAIFYSPEFDLYGIGYFSPGNDHGDGGLGNPWLYFDGQTGAFAGSLIPGSGSAGDIFMQAQFPLHSGRILGLPGRILVSAMGLMVAMLSITGIIIWARKRRARQRR